MITCHEIIGDLEVKEVLHPSGGLWGSTHIDDQFAKLLEMMFSKDYVEEYKKEAPADFVKIIYTFQKAKKKFYGK